MAARARGAAAAAARSTGEEGGRASRTILYLIRGRSPALGDIRIYALLPRPTSLGSLGRLGAVLSADPGFEAEWIESEELPFPAHGYALVGVDAEGRPRKLILDALTPEAKRALDDYRGRVVVARHYAAPTIPLNVVEKALEFAERVGAQLELRRVGSESWIVLRSPRPLSFDERHTFLHDYAEASDGFLLDNLLLKRLGLPELAGMAPTARCWRVPALPGEEPWRCERDEEEEPAIVRTDIQGLEREWRAVETPIVGSRGEAELSGFSIYFWASRADREMVEALKEAQRAADELRDAIMRWRALVHVFGRAAHMTWFPREPPEALTARAAEEGRTRVWEEGGAIRVWVPAGELREQDLREIRKMEIILGRRVELVSEKPPFRFSPEADAAAERLRRALKRAVGSA
jgi:hypothetical protein